MRIIDWSSDVCSSDLADLNSKNQTLSQFQRIQTSSEVRDFVPEPGLGPDDEGEVPLAGNQIPMEDTAAWVNGCRTGRLDFKGDYKLSCTNGGNFCSRLGHWR